MFHFVSNLKVVEKNVNFDYFEIEMPESSHCIKRHLDLDFQVDVNLD